jgi:hypothetical protein
MASGNYNHDCAEGVMERVGFSGKMLNAVDLCIGNIDAGAQGCGWNVQQRADSRLRGVADAPNALMEAEQALQADANNTGAGTIIIMPTARALARAVYVQR